MRSSAKLRRGFTLIEVLVTIAIIGALVAVLLPAVQTAREAARRMSCGNNLKQIGLALHNYHDVYGRLPANGFVKNAGTNTETNVSWSLAITPHIEQNGLHDRWWYQDRYDKDGRHAGKTPTDATDPSNYWVVRQPVATYLCPSDGTNDDGVSTTQAGYGHFGHPVGVTNYKGVMGANWSFAPWTTRGSEFGGPANDPFTKSNGIFACGALNLQSTRFARITDGLSNTLMVGEAIPAHQYFNSWAAFYFNQTATCAVPLNASATCSMAISGNWEQDRVACRQVAPDIYTIGMSFASRHSGGGQFAVADGSVRFVPDSIDLRLYRSLGTCGGGETVSWP